MASRSHRVLVIGQVALAIGLVTITSRAQPREDVTARSIPDRIVVRAPLGSCTVPRIAAAVGRYAQIPTGVEQLPGPCSPDATEWAATEVLHLQGMPVDDALEKLVKLDPRYYWTEADGVIIVRPVAAWADPKHFLHGVLDRLTLDKADIGQALHAAVAPLRPALRSSPDRVSGMSGVGEITIDVGPISIIEALDAIVRKHGRARWQVSYCRPEAVFLYARIFLYSFDFVDQRGIGINGPRPQDDKGNYYDPCAAR